MLEIRGRAYKEDAKEDNRRIKTGLIPAEVGGTWIRIIDPSKLVLVQCKTEPSHAQRALEPYIEAALRSPC